MALDFDEIGERINTIETNEDWVKLYELVFDVSIDDVIDERGFPPIDKIVNAILSNKPIIPEMPPANADW